MNRSGLGEAKESKRSGGVGRNNGMRVWERFSTRWVNFISPGVPAMKRLKTAL